MSLCARNDSLNALYHKIPNSPGGYDEYDPFFQIIADTALLFQEDESDATHIFPEKYTPSRAFSPLGAFCCPSPESSALKDDGGHSPWEEYDDGDLSDASADSDPDVEPLSLDRQVGADFGLVQRIDDEPFIPVDGPDPSSQFQQDNEEKPILAPEFSPLQPPSVPFSHSESDERPPSVPSDDDKTVEQPSRTVYKRSATSPPRIILDEEDDDHSEDTDDEYKPSPKLHPRKRQRISSDRPSKVSTKKRKVSTKKRKARSSKGTGVARLSRNRQSKDPELADYLEDMTALEDLDFKCPVCPWEQLNERLPDLQRHLRTHLRPHDDDIDKGWRCKGVLWEERHLYGILDSAQPYEFRGQKRVGGCMKTFSRRDALKRHLDNENVSCVGKACAAAED
ncbi:hypothetical protein K435DRAFT_962208 [Dendrothele bispora CBS 962.96]|uniref:Uncharacterized protein n=1 Tax=Dendrothele bispora (strain CBS 962.96) TaxID=1314807 RepID=A0A4S8MLX6_DENBC|nr:hypothetical protein K435DRAFT_962208 [Dendrothele bispora CBS 962.96]